MHLLKLIKKIESHLQKKEKRNYKESLLSMKKIKNPLKKMLSIMDMVLL